MPRRFGVEGYEFEIVEGWPQVEIQGVAADVPVRRVREAVAEDVAPQLAGAGEGHQRLA